MADLQPLLPRKILPLSPIGDAPPVVGLDMGGGMPTLPPFSPAPITADPRASSISSDPLITQQSQLEADLYNRTNPVKPTTTLGKIGHVAANVGNVLGDIFAPDVMANIPGTQLYNERIEKRDKADLQANSQLQTEEAGRKQQAATTALTLQQPELQRAKVLSTLAGKVVPKGFKPPTFDENGDLQLDEDPDSQAFKDNVALAGMHNATANFDSIKAENADAKYQPGTPQYTEWKQRLDNAQKEIQVRMGALGLSRERLGFQEDKTYNPQPTSTERNKGDMGNSAIDQIHTMRSIVAAHPEFAGPGAGATQAFQRWLSGNGEDAGKFLAARQYLADHSAAVFGGRGQYISQQMEGLTNPNFSPSTLGGVLDQAEETAGRFTKAGQTHNKAGVLQPQQSATPVVPHKTYNPKTGRIE
jgi:hypothetical protein